MALILDPTGSPISADAIELTRAEMAWFAAAEDLCKRLRVNLYCPRCQAKGLPDGLQGRNAAGDTDFAVHCGCTRRVYRRGGRTATAPAANRRAGLPEFTTR